MNEIEATWSNALSRAYVRKSFHFPKECVNVQRPCVRECALPLFCHNCTVFSNATASVG